MKPNSYLLVSALLATTTLAHGDFTYQETTQITGGSMLGMMKMAGTFSKQARLATDPIVSTVMVKGNRMTRIDKDHTEIIDLDRGTVTEIDALKKQYTVMTFEQMKRQMEASIAKAKAEQEKQAQEKQAQQKPSPGDAQNVDLKFNVHVKNTGASKEVAGLNANEAILAMTMEGTDKTSGQKGAFAVTSDLWLAPEIPGYEEVREFYIRYGMKLGTMMSGVITPQMIGMMQQPGASAGMADMVKEMSKLKGIPVLQIMRVGVTADGVALPAASEAALPTAAPMPSAGDLVKQSATSAIAEKLTGLGGLGSLGGFGRKKKQEAAAPAEAAVVTPTSGVLIEANTQLTGFSKASVDASVFTPPASFKQVEPRTVE